VFDWFCEFSREGLSDEDQALLDTDVDALDDPVEAKQMLRRQRKALKRARAKNRSFTSIATPEVVAMVEKVCLLDPAKAADRLFFLAACAPLLAPQQLVWLCDRITGCRIVASSSGGLTALRDAFGGVASLNAFNSPVDALEAVWWLSHAPSSVRKPFVEVKKGLVKGKPDFMDKLGKTPPPSNTWMEFDEDYLFYNVPAVYRPKANYSHAVKTIQSASSLVTPRLLPGQTFSVDDFFEFYETLKKRGDFETTEKARHDIEIDGATVQTICSSEELKENGV
jgi:hypothetical protein